MKEVGVAFAQFADLKAQEIENAQEGYGGDQQRYAAKEELARGDDFRRGRVKRRQRQQSGSAAEKKAERSNSFHALIRRPTTDRKSVV